MEQFRLHRESVLHRALNEELTAFKNSTSLSELISGDVNDSFKGGNVLCKVLPKRVSLIKLLSSLKNISSYTDPEYAGNYSCYTPLFRDVTESIVNIPDAGDITAALKLLESVIADIGGEFYGALLISGKTIINPLHPLVAMSLLEDSPIKAVSNWRIVIYTFNNAGVLHQNYSSESAEISRIDENINSLIQSFSAQVPTEIRGIDSQVSESGETATVRFQVKKHKDEEDNVEMYLSAHQMITAGIVCPYYGTSVIKMNGGTSGTGVTPMLSCNLSSPSVTEHNWTYSTDSENVPKNSNWSSVCTGNLNNRTLHGLRSLTHANTLSPYNTRIMGVGALVYAERCVQKSLEIYKTSEMI